MALETHGPRRPSLCVGLSLRWGFGLGAEGGDIFKNESLYSKTSTISFCYYQNHGIGVDDRPPYLFFTSGLPFRIATWRGLVQGWVSELGSTEVLEVTQTSRRWLGPQ